MTPTSLTQLIALYRLMLRQQLTTGRLILAGGFGAVFIIVSFALSRADGTDLERIEGAVVVAWLLGMGLIIPIVTLVLSASSIGDLIDDETLVYLWHRPIPRWMLAAAAWGASISVTAPLTILPITVGTAMSSHGDGTAVWAVAVASLLALVGYSGLFVLLGLMVRRALIWGLLYVFIWEQFIARVGGGAAKLSIQNYPSSVLSNLTDTSLELADRSMTTGIIVPIIVGAIAVGLTAWRLNHIDVA